MMNNRIKLLRKQLKLTQEELGKKLAISGASVSKLEIGENNPSQQTINLICSVFNVSRDWLLNGTGPMFAENSAKLLDTVCKQYDLDEAGRAVLEMVLTMPKEYADMVVDMAHRIVDAQATTKAPSAPANADDAINAEVNSYRQQLLLEKRVKGESFHSPAGDETGAG